MTVKAIFLNTNKFLFLLLSAGFLFSLCFSYFGFFFLDNEGKITCFSIFFFNSENFYLKKGGGIICYILRGGDGPEVGDCGRGRQLGRYSSSSSIHFSSFSFSFSLFSLSVFSFSLSFSSSFSDFSFSSLSLSPSFSAFFSSSFPLVSFSSGGGLGR